MEIDSRALCVLRETLAYHDGLADFAFAMQGLGTGAISLSGSGQMKQRVLPKIAQGSLVSAFALTEPDAGSDVAAMRSSAVKDGNDVVLNGEKTFISNGGIADVYTVFARTGEAPGTRGISAFVMFADTPGFEIVERIETSRASSARPDSIQRLSSPRDRSAGHAQRGIQDCHADAGYLPRVRCGCRQRLRSPCAR